MLNDMTTLFVADNIEHGLHAMHRFENVLSCDDINMFRHEAFQRVNVNTKRFTDFGADSNMFRRKCGVLAELNSGFQAVVLYPSKLGNKRTHSQDKTISTSAWSYDQIMSSKTQFDNSTQIIPTTSFRQMVMIGACNDPAYLLSCIPGIEPPRSRPNTERMSQWLAWQLRSPRHTLLRGKDSSQVMQECHNYEIDLFAKRQVVSSVPRPQRISNIATIGVTPFPSSSSTDEPQFRALRNISTNVDDVKLSSSVDQLHNMPDHDLAIQWDIEDVPVRNVPVSCRESTNLLIGHIIYTALYNLTQQYI